MDKGIVYPFIVFLIGIYGLSVSKNIIKSIICLNTSQTSAILIFLKFAAQTGRDVPIERINGGAMVDPLPQALMITAIVIGASITALSLVFTIKIFHYYGTLNWEELIERKG